MGALLILQPGASAMPREPRAAGATPNRDAATPRGLAGSYYLVGSAAAVVHNNSARWSEADAQAWGKRLQQRLAERLGDDELAHGELLAPEQLRTRAAQADVDLEDEAMEVLRAEGADLEQLADALEGVPEGERSEWMELFFEAAALKRPFEEHLQELQVIEWLQELRRHERGD